MTAELLGQILERLRSADRGDRENIARLVLAGPPRP
jgi:hypothetical protein